MATTDEISQKVKEQGVEIEVDKFRHLVSDSPADDLRWYILDSKQVAIPRDLLKEMIQATGTDARKYRPEEYDCDDFAISMAGVVRYLYGFGGVGIVLDFSGKHAYNCALIYDTDDSGNKTFDLVFVEPQTDRIVNRGEAMSDHEAYKMKQGVVVF